MEQQASTNQSIPEISQEGTQTNDIPVTAPANIEHASSDRPAWLPEKFKNPEDLVSSYKEAESKITQLSNEINGAFGAPEQYHWSGSGDEPDGVKLFKAIAKEHNLSQKTFDSIVNGYISKEDAIIEAHKKQLAIDAAEIGDERIKRVGNLINGLSLNEDQLGIVDKVFTKNRKGFEVLESILQKIDDTVKSAPSIAPNPVDIEKELEEIYSQPDYVRNPSKYDTRVNELTRMKLDRL